LELVYRESFEGRYEALKRERYFKSGPGKKFLREALAEKN